MFSAYLIFFCHPPYRQSIQTVNKSGKTKHSMVYTFYKCALCSFPRGTCLMLIYCTYKSVPSELIRLQVWNYMYMCMYIVSDISLHVGHTEKKGFEVPCFLHTNISRQWILIVFTAAQAILNPKPFHVGGYVCTHSVTLFILNGSEWLESQFFLYLKRNIKCVRIYSGCGWYLEQKVSVL